MKPSKPFILAVVFYMCIFALTTVSYAYICGSLAVGAFLNEADFVCHGKVLSTRPRGDVEPDTSFQPPLMTGGGIARVHVLLITV